MSSESPIEGELSDLTPVERLALECYRVGELASAILISLSFVVLVLDWRPGAYVLVAGLAYRFVAQQLATWVFARRAGDLASLTRLERGSLGAGLLFFVVLAVGAFAAVLGSSAGAYVALAGLAGTLGSHLVAGVSHYRGVMARTWPEVPPLSDEDDDW